MASPRGAYEASALETEETRSEGEVGLDRSLLFGTDASGSPRASCADRADIGIDDAWFKRQSFDGHFEPFAATFRDDAWGDARAFEASDSVTSEGGRSSSASTARAEATNADDAGEEAPRRNALQTFVAFETRPDDLDPDMLRRIRYLTTQKQVEKEVEFSSSIHRSSFDDDDGGAIGVRDETLATPRDLFRVTKEADDDDVWFADADDDAARRLSMGDFSEGRHFEDENEDDDVTRDTFFAALLELYDNWSPSDRSRFLRRSGTLDGARRARLRRALLARLEKNDRFSLPDAFPNACCDAERDPEDVFTRRVLDAFVRVFGRTPKTANDFRLCVRPYAARDIASGGIAELVHPEKMGLGREIEVATGETRTVRTTVRTGRTSREEEATYMSRDRERTRFPRTCLYFDAQGWCPLGTRCPAKAAHVFQKTFFNAQPPRASRAREALRESWDKQDDPNLPPDFRREGYPYVSFCGNDACDARTFELLLKARSRAEKVPAEDEKSPSGSNEPCPVWSSPARRKSGTEASTRD